MPCGPQNLPGSWLRSAPNRPIRFPSRSTMLKRSSSSATYIRFSSGPTYSLVGRPKPVHMSMILAVWREDLDAVALAVRHVDLAVVLPDAMHGVEVARLVLGVAQLLGVADLAPGLEQRAVRRVLVDAAVAVAVRDVDLAARPDAARRSGGGTAGQGSRRRSASAGRRRTRFGSPAWRTSRV